ncbi:MAG: prolyl oligopeptidase family serine peptidase [Flavobacteriaceae bacterium]|nr:prolyl oligopeptidase family serine peptidase [Flavobacteriaceae bacterium]
MIHSQTKISFLSLITLVYFLLVANISDSFAQKKQKTLTPKDYKKWENLTDYAISNDGNWVTYQVNNGEYDQTLFLYNSKTNKKKEFKNADRSTFSKNNEWLAYSKILPGKESEKLAKKRKTAKDKSKYLEPVVIKILNLNTQDTLEFKDVKQYSFNNKGSYIAMDYFINKTNTLIVKNLKNGKEISFGNIVEFAWQDQGDLLALITETKDSLANSIQIYNPISGNIKVLGNKKAIYKGMQWKKKSADLFALRTVKNKSYKGESVDLLIWKELNTNNPKLLVFNQNKYTNFPKETKILERGIKFSKNWDYVYFSTYKWEEDENAKKKSEKEKDEKEKSKKSDNDAPEVEIWNSKDVVIIPAQKKSKMKDLATPKVAMWNVSKNTFIELEGDLLERINSNLDNKVVLGLDRTPYDFSAMFGRPYYDIYTINKETGTKKKVLSKIVYVNNVSPNNRYFVYVKDDNLYLFDIQNNKSVNITSNLDDSFFIDDDHPVDQRRAYGFGKWTKDSKSFYINSEFDIWQVYTNGNKTRKITNGKKDNLIYRIINLDREENYIDFSKPILFSVEDKWTKKTGVAKGIAGEKIKTLTFENNLISRFVKSKDFNKILFKKQSYTNSPNVFITDLNFKSLKQISDTNKFQKDFAWGKAVLIDYTNAQGKKSQGILYYPANYKKGEKYPMITYIYERLSNRFQDYVRPSETSYYNTTVWVQNGYFVFKPDIEFTAGDPGISSARNLELAVKKVVEIGDVNPDKVGLIGHSWGGYQAGYVPTQTNIFAASVAGAGLTELIAMNLAVTPAFGGQPENNHFEVGQERMQTPPWKSPDNYVRNSSVMQVDKLNTPVLFEVGDNDQNVNWSQGVAYYNAARRAGKPFVLLVYAKEGHGLRKKENQIDYQQRILKWFGHYLKGEKAEDWITDGIPYGEQQKRLKNWGKNK